MMAGVDQLRGVSWHALHLQDEQWERENFTPDNASKESLSFAMES
jgi:hypothetical protein